MDTVTRVKEFQFRLREKIETDIGARLVIIAIAILTAYVTYTAATSFARLKEAEYFHSESLHRIVAIERGISEHLEAVSSIAILFSLGVDIPYREFNRFSSPYLRQLTGLQKVMWIPVVSRQERDAFVRRQAGSWPDFSIRQLGDDGIQVEAREKDEYLPVSYVFPLASNDQLVGLDIGDRREFIDGLKLAAKKHDAVIIDPSILSVSMERSDKLVISPVLDQNFRLKGFVAGLVSLPGILEYSLQPFVTGDLTFHISNEGGTYKTVYSYSDNITGIADLAALPLKPDIVNKSLFNQRTVKVANESWRVSVEPAPGYSVIKQRYLYWIPVIAVLAVSGLIMTYIVLLQRREEFFQRVSMLDGLTGVYNREYFDAAFRSEWQRAVRRNLSLGVLIVDVDDFRQYNMQVGHVEADKSLVSIAGVLQNSSRRSGDCVCRYERDEFVMLLPATPKEGLSRIAEKVRQRIEDLSIPNRAGPYGVMTVTVAGVVLNPHKNDSIDIVIDQLDEILQKAKQQGKNLVLIEEVGEDFL